MNYVPNGAAMLIGKETKQQNIPFGPISQHKGFSLPILLSILPTIQHVPHKAMGMKKGKNKLFCVP